MAISEHVPLGEVKNRLSEVVDRIERAHGRVIITKHGQPSAVIMNLEDLESLEETLAVLSNPRMVKEIRQAQTEITAGKARRLTKDEAARLAKHR
ncbi:MAG: type II toxin-antitoxin system Phd/YefM family antitoxin [Actinomycetota bacterium]